MLLTEIKFQIDMVEYGMITKKDFAKTIGVIYAHYNGKKDGYSYLYKDALKWFRKS
tara:strand:- start:7575 stop:7742 length:168 start_codon:yes stop_codon:yes gene_type:complete